MFFLAHNPGVAQLPPPPHHQGLLNSPVQPQAVQRTFQPVFVPQTQQVCCQLYIYCSTVIGLCSQI